jgi:hypothetical protein
MKKINQLVILSQVVFLVMVGVCVTILPHFVFERDEGGMSNFGVHAATIPFYTLAFSMSAILLLRAAYLVSHQNGHHPLTLVFIGTACALLLELATTYPYQLNNAFNTIHVAVNIVASLFEVVAGSWVAGVLVRTRATALLLSCLLAAFILGVLTFLGTIHILFITQILGAISFGSLLIASTTLPTGTRAEETVRSRKI